MHFKQPDLFTACHVTGPKDETGIPTSAGMIGVVQVEDAKPLAKTPAEHRNH